ncbi:hypothetical protein MMB232_02915 [Brevundimonas subvibrioides]|uniref:2'-5' RNA ligase family protein n=1 Tax=Brevundimonas subvibrioides TaxID=74313 RepID=UPI0032D57ACD
MADHPPLIVTAALDDGAFAWFEDLRQSHFPRHRNKVPAHVTLFHALPGEHEDAVVETLRAACARRRPVQVDVRGPWFLGNGVAYRLGSAELEQLRAELAGDFAPWLTRQDQARYRPHITIQNKAEPEEARRLLEQLQLEFEPFPIFAEGLLLWRYLGGPWALVDRFAFDAA